MIDAWSLNQSSCVMMITIVFEVEVDYVCIRRIIHVDASLSLLDYAQETERASRDDLSATCLILLSVEWIMCWEKKFQSDFLIENRM